MGAINIGAKNGGKVKVVAPDNPAVGTEARLPDHSGTLATIEDVNRISDLGNYMPKAGGTFTGGVGISWKVPGYLVESFSVSDNHDNKVLSIWNNGSVQTKFKDFKENDLVTKAYVDRRADGSYVACEQFWTNASWNIDNMVDAVVSQIKVHNDRTALVLNKNGTDTNIIMDWENELAPYPSYFGIKIDDKIHFVEVEFTGRGGQNNRGYNFKILSHNLPETVANDTVVGICPNYKPESLTVADYQNFMPDGGTLTGDVTYNGATTSSNHIATKVYVDNAINAVPQGLGELYTLQTNNNSYLFSNGLDAPTDTSFRTGSTSMQYNKEFHFKKLYAPDGTNAYLKDYEATPSTMLEIYNRGVLLVRTTIKDYKASTRGNNSMMFYVSGSSASVHNYSSLENNNYYQIILTNMRKK